MLRGSIQVCKMFIPCIEPTISDAKKTESTAPLFTATGISNAAIKETEKYIKQHFCTLLIL